MRKRVGHLGSLEKVLLYDQMQRQIAELSALAKVSETATSPRWTLVEPYLRENERLFGIPVEALLAVEGEHRQPAEV